jgi:hypothetical protein
MASTTGQATIHARMKKADVTSGVGAGILGGGVGVLVAPYLGPYAVPLIVVGIVMHAWGMYERHRLDAAAPRVWWAEGLYWLCWGILIAIGVFALVRG